MMTKIKINKKNIKVFDFSADRMIKICVYGQR